uniref:Uncharacterized protein n=1 Tax=Arundo donax TaxID=35708 RepID=A0A0A9GL13_ARUDO
MRNSCNYFNTLVNRDHKSIPSQITK